MSILHSSTATLLLILILVTCCSTSNITSTQNHFLKSNSNETLQRQETPVQEAISEIMESEGALETFGNIFNLFSTVLKGFSDLPGKAFALFKPKPTSPPSPSVDVATALINNQLRIQNQQQQQQIKQLQQKHLLEQLLEQYKKEPQQQKFIQQLLEQLLIQQPPQQSSVGAFPSLLAAPQPLLLAPPQPIQVVALAPTSSTRRPTTERSTDPEDGDYDGDS